MNRMISAPCDPEGPWIGLYGNDEASLQPNTPGDTTYVVTLECFRGLASRIASLLPSAMHGRAV